MVYTHRPSTRHAPSTVPLATTLTTTLNTAKACAILSCSFTLTIPHGNASPPVPPSLIYTPIPTQNCALLVALADCSLTIGLVHACLLSTAPILPLETLLPSDAWNYAPYRCPASSTKASTSALLFVLRGSLLITQLWYASQSVLLHQISTL